jgi:hypothetical protein
VVGDEDVVPAVDRVRDHVRGRGVHHLVGPRGRGRVRRHQHRFEQAAGEEIRVEDYVGMDRVLSFTMLVAVLDVVLLTAIATLGAFLYNLAASLLGGLEVTLAEDEH